MKKIFYSFVLFFIIVSKIISVSASDSVMARIGNNYYGSLEEALKAAGPNDIISLTNNVTLKDSLEINKTVNIDLNNHNIKAKDSVFLVQGGSLNLSGKGMVFESEPNYGAVILKGSNDSNQTNYSTVTVGSDVILEGWSGIFITHENNTSHGIIVNMDGGINAVDDTNGGAGIGIYVNGNIKHENNSPIINLGKTAHISSSGDGIYSAGYATYNIDGAYISGKEAGLAIKSGVFNIKDGIIVGSGEDKTPTSGNNNGINPSGAAIQIESNPEYIGNIELNIENGTIQSKNSNVIYEYVVNNSNTQVKNINISGGKFISDSNKDVFSLSDSFKNNHKGFISGGTYSSNPNEFLKNGYTTNKNENNLYEVITGTISVFGFNNSNNNNIFIPFIILASIIILGIITYLNRTKIVSIFK